MAIGFHGDHELEKGQPNGVAGLDSGGVVPNAQLEMFSTLIDSLNMDFSVSKRSLMLKTVSGAETWTFSNAVIHHEIQVDMTGSGDITFPSEFTVHEIARVGTTRRFARIICTDDTVSSEKFIVLYYKDDPTGGDAINTLQFESASFTAEYSKSHAVRTSVAAVTVTLPDITASDHNKRLEVQDLQGNAENNIITINTAGGATILGLSTILIATNFDSITFIAAYDNGTKYWIIN